MAMSSNWMFVLLLCIAGNLFSLDHTPRSSNAGADYVEKINVYMKVDQIEIVPELKGRVPVFEFPIFWDSAFDTPDPQVSVKINGQERWTNHCNNTYKCNCPDCNLEWLDMSEPFQYTVTVWDHDITNHDKVGENTFEFARYHRRDDDIKIGTEFNFDSVFKGSADILVKYIYKPCTTRTPINGRCSASYETQGCNAQPLATSTKCVIGCNQFYFVRNAGQCDRVACVNRTAVDGKCWSNDYVTDSGINGNCGYFNGRCGSCPSIHYTTSRDGVCILKPCSERIPYQFTPDLDGIYEPATPCSDSCNRQPNGTCNTGCPLNYEAVNGNCTLKACSERKYPCQGSGDCFQQLDPAGDGTHSTTCDIACGESLSVRDGKTGSCQLKVCEKRTPNLTHTAFPCGDSSCLRVVYAEDPIGGCANSCNPAHFIAESIPGHCHAMVCEERGKVNTTSPCGPGECFWDLGDTDADTKCSSNCTNDKHFKKQERNHTCVLKDCAERQENLTGGGDWPCGLRDDDPLACYANTGRDSANGGTDCATACSNSEHYEQDPRTGRCVEKKCENRIRNNSATSPCGSGVCYLDGNAYAEANEMEAVYGQCRPFCMNPDHFAPDTAIGECVERECKFRTANTSETVPCGSGYCFADTGAGVGVCKDLQHAYDNYMSNETDNDNNDTNNETDDGCTHATHYEAVEAKHRCILKQCAERKRDDKAVYVCGDKTCFFYRECGLECPDTHTSDEIGVCIENNLQKGMSQAAGVAIAIIVPLVIITAATAAVVIIVLVRRKKRQGRGGSGNDEATGSGQQNGVIMEEVSSENSQKAGNYIKNVLLEGVEEDGAAGRADAVASDRSSRVGSLTLDAEQALTAEDE